jgi:DNA (cytosine-5)-methyltransferase 1
MTDLPAVSLFSNCGAGDMGYAQAGFQFEVMAELDARRLSVALLNHKRAAGVAGDLRETLPGVFRAYRSVMRNRRPALLAACPPCQGMSSARAGRGSGSDPEVGSRDHRNLLVSVIAEAVAELRPRMVVVENVPAFLTRAVRDPRDRAAVSAARLLVGLLRPKYVAYPLLADLSEFGVPQTRRRTFLTFIRRDERAVRFLDGRAAAPYPRPTHSADYGSGPVTLRDALLAAGLGALDASSPDLATSDDPMHAVPVWDSSRYQMVATIPPGSGRSAWQSSDCLACGATTDDPDAATCVECDEHLPRPVVQEADGSYRLITGFRASSYRRMNPDRPAATITTGSGHTGSDLTIHPWENRVLSPSECSLLQTLPPTFTWGDALEKWGHSNVRAMIGEAVPPLFTNKHGRILAALLSGRRSPALISAFDPRCTRAARKLEERKR